MSFRPAVTLSSTLPIGQATPIGRKRSGISSRWSQFVWLSGELCSWPGFVPSTSASPRGTTTSQQDRPTRWPAWLVRGSPQPSPGASRAV